MNARQRLSLLCDPDSFRELDPDLEPGDPLGFPGYARKLETARSASGERGWGNTRASLS